MSAWSRTRSVRSDAAGTVRPHATWLARDDCTISRTSLHAERLVLTEHHHGLAPRQFADFEHGEPLVALRLSTSDLAKPVVLWPTGDPAAVIVEAVRNREVIWPLAKLRLSGTKADIDTDDLAVVLRLYPPSRRSLQPLGTSERLSQDALF